MTKWWADRHHTSVAVKTARAVATAAAAATATATAAAAAEATAAEVEAEKKAQAAARVAVAAAEAAAVATRIATASSIRTCRECKREYKEKEEAIRVALSLFEQTGDYKGGPGSFIRSAIEHVQCLTLKCGTCLKYPDASTWDSKRHGPLEPDYTMAAAAAAARAKSGPKRKLNTTGRRKSALKKAKVHADLGDDDDDDDDAVDIKAKADAIDNDIDALAVDEEDPDDPYAGEEDDDEEEDAADDSDIDLDEKDDIAAPVTGLGGKADARNLEKQRSNRVGLNEIEANIQKLLNAPVDEYLLPHYGVVDSNKAAIRASLIQYLSMPKFMADPSTFMTKRKKLIKRDTVLQILDRMVWDYVRNGEEEDDDDGDDTTPAAAAAAAAEEDTGWIGRMQSDPIQSYMTPENGVGPDRLVRMRVFGTVKRNLQDPVFLRAPREFLLKHTPAPTPGRPINPVVAILTALVNAYAPVPIPTAATAAAADTKSMPPPKPRLDKTEELRRRTVNRLAASEVSIDQFTTSPTTIAAAAEAEDENGMISSDDVERLQQAATAAERKTQSDKTKAAAAASAASDAGLVPAQYDMTEFEKGEKKGRDDATALIMQQLAELTKCPICLELATLPIITACGHMLCWNCHVTMSGRNMCPLCRTQMGAITSTETRRCFVLSKIAKLAKGVPDSNETYTEGEFKSNEKLTRAKVRSLNFVRMTKAYTDWMGGAKATDTGIRLRIVCDVDQFTEDMKVWTKHENVSPAYMYRVTKWNDDPDSYFVITGRSIRDPNVLPPPPRPNSQTQDDSELML